MLVQVPAAIPAFTVRLHGKGASPKVDLVGPDGRRIAMTDAGGRRAGRRLAHDRHQPRGRHDLDHGRQPGGRRVEDRAARRLRRDHRGRPRDSEPEPTMGAGVGGTGDDRTLGYAYSPNPGQKITFVERGDDAQILGMARDGRCKGEAGGVETDRAMACGRLRTPATGPAGRREIVAVIEQDGRPRDEQGRDLRRPEGPPPGASAAAAGPPGPGGRGADPLGVRAGRAGLHRVGDDVGRPQAVVRAVLGPQADPGRARRPRHRALRARSTGPVGSASRLRSRPRAGRSRPAKAKPLKKKKGGRR